MSIYKVNVFVGSDLAIYGLYTGPFLGLFPGFGFSSWEHSSSLKGQGTQNASPWVPGGKTKISITTREQQSQVIFRDGSLSCGCFLDVMGGELPSRHKISRQGTPHGLLLPQRSSASLCPFILMDFLKWSSRWSSSLLLFRRPCGAGDGGALLSNCHSADRVLIWFKAISQASGFCSSKNYCSW